MAESALPRARQSTGIRTSSGGLSRLVFRAMGGAGKYVRWSTATMWQSVKLLGFAAMEILTTIWFAAWLVLSVLGWKRVVPPFDEFRRNTARQRRWAEYSGGGKISERYGPDLEPDITGTDLLKAELKDSQRAKDLDWHLLNPGITLVTAGVPFGAGVVGLPLAVYLGMTIAADVVGLREALYPVFGLGQELLGWQSWWSGMQDTRWWSTVSLAAGVALGAPLVARLFQKLHAGWIRFMLAEPGRETELAERVETLTQTRKTALELQTAEVQRIERDLHDGAQAHLVTVGMTLTQASRLIDLDPTAAKTLLETAKGDSAIALQELRTLVRGIRPPVLADRGLTDALRSLTSGLPIQTTVSSTLSHRPVAAIESALYFAISELLTNAVKHSAASQITVELTDGPHHLTAVVTDNGIGGAEHQEQPGGGIHGIRRRLEPFDGTLEILSPIGGGTTARIHLPHPATTTPTP